jgi:hypothetical protein
MPKATDPAPQIIILCGKGTSASGSTPGTTYVPTYYILGF